MKIRALTTVGVSAMLLSGCTTGDFLAPEDVYKTSDYRRMDGVSMKGGEAIAANSVMQMVDPWPKGVEHTDIRTPSDRKMAKDEVDKEDRVDILDLMRPPPTTKAP